MLHMDIPLLYHHIKKQKTRMQSINIANTDVLKSFTNCPLKLIAISCSVILDLVGLHPLHSPPAVTTLPPPPAPTVTPPMNGSPAVQCQKNQLIIISSFYRFEFCRSFISTKHVSCVHATIYR